MSVKVEELMTKSVVAAQPHQSVDHVRKMFEKNNISAVPVLDSEGKPVGVISSTDLARDLKPHTPIKQLMTEKVLTVTAYDDTSIAARVMRNHGIHRVIVTHEGKVAGVLSSFDLLKLVEDHRFVQKNAPTPSKRKGNKRH